MILIIDGNNLIGRKITTVSDGHTIKKDLTLKMVKYVAMTGRKVKIVFDGIEDTNYPDGIIFKGVQIFYAKGRRKRGRKNQKYGQKCILRSRHYSSFFRSGIKDLCFRPGSQSNDKRGF